MRTSIVGLQLEGSRILSIAVVGLALILSVAWFLGSPGLVHACTCVAPGPPSEEIEKFDAVFTGRVVSMQLSGDTTTVGFEVNTVWKGIVSEDVHVTTSSTGGSCGFTFEEGEEYIVYARHSTDADVSYSVDICSRTALLSQAQVDLDALGDGDAPLAGAGGSQSEGSQGTAEGRSWVVVLGAVAGIILLGVLTAGVWVRRRRR